jgi:hypothetical protein
MSVAEKTQKVPGRPRKTPENRKRNVQVVRVRDALREKLASAAELFQRSISEEMEARLERSFELERRIGGEKGARALQLVLEAAAAIQAAVRTENGQDWEDDLKARIMLSGAIEVLLDDARPIPALPPEPGLLGEQDEAVERQRADWHAAAASGRDLANNLLHRDSLTKALAALVRMEKVAPTEQAARIEEAKAMVQRGLTLTDEATFPTPDDISRT